VKLGCPRREENPGFAIELGGVGADDDLLGLGNKRLLESGDFDFAGPDSSLGEALGTEENEVEFPELGRAACGGPEQDRLALKEPSAEEMDFDLGTAEHFGNGQAVGDRAKARDGFAIERLGEGEDGGTAVEKTGRVFRDEGAGLLGEARLDIGIYRAAIGERSKCRVEVAEGAPVGAGDFLFADENAEIAPSGGLGNAEARTDFGGGEGSDGSRAARPAIGGGRG